MWNDLLVLVFIIIVRRMGDHGNDSINRSNDKTGRTFKIFRQRARKIYRIASLDTIFDKGLDNDSEAPRSPLPGSFLTIISLCIEWH